MKGILIILVIFLLYLLPQSVYAQTSGNPFPIDLSFPPGLLLEQDTIQTLREKNDSTIVSWKVPLNEAIIKFLDGKFSDDSPSTTKQVTQIVQPAYNVSDNVSIVTTSDSNYKTNIVITNSKTNNQTIIFPEKSGEVSLLGQTISGDEILDNTIDLLTKTTGNFIANLTGGNGLDIVGGGAAGAIPSLSLGNLTGDWIQSGPYNIILNNPQSKLKIIDASGTHFATFAVPTLASDVTYTLSGTAGTLLTSTNYGDFLSALGAGDLLSTNNLSELTNFSTARNNLGLGSAAIQNVSDFLQTANNLSDLPNALSARSSLGLGTIATQSAGNAFLSGGSLSGVTIPAAANIISGLSISNFSSAALSQWINDSGFITPSTTDTLTNKTLTAPVINGTVATTGLTFPAFSSGAINGLTFTSEANGFSIAGGTASKTLTFVNSLAFAGTDGTTFTFPSGSDTVAGLTTAQTLTNKTINAGSNTIAALTTANFTSANISQWTNNLGFMTPSSIETLTNKTLTAPAINGIVTTSGLTLPTFTAGGTITGSGSPTITNFGAINGLTLAATSDGLTLSGGTTSRTLTVAGGDITIGNVIKPTSSGSLSIQSNGANPLILDSGGNAGITIGIGNANAITLGASATVSAGKTLSVTDTDSLRVGGAIIPQTVTVVVPFENITVLGLGSLVDHSVFIADTNYQLSGVRCVYAVAAGLNASLQLSVDTGTGAPGSGIDQLTSAIALNASINTVYTGTLIGTPTTMQAGDKLSIDFSGTLSTVLGTCTLTLKRV